MPHPPNSLSRRAVVAGAVFVSAITSIGCTASSTTPRPFPAGSSPTTAATPRATTTTAAPALTTEVTAPRRITYQVSTGDPNVGVTLFKGRTADEVCAVGWLDRAAADPPNAQRPMKVNLWEEPNPAGPDGGYRNPTTAGRWRTSLGDYSATPRATDCFRCDPAVCDPDNSTRRFVFQAWDGGDVVYHAVADLPSAQIGTLPRHDEFTLSLQVLYTRPHAFAEAMRRWAPVPSA